jgi:uncharacterized CHY-type Zn-finger protein
MSHKLLGVCGLYCGACVRYLASFSEDEHLLQKLQQKEQTVKELICHGCRMKWF